MMIRSSKGSAGEVYGKGGGVNRYMHIRWDEMAPSTEKYRKQATEQGIDAEWIEKYVPAVGAKDETL